MAARALARRGRDPRRAAPGDRALGRPRRERSTSTTADAGGARPRVRRCADRLRRPGRAARRRGRRPRHGHPGSRQEPRRRGVRRPRLRPAQPRRARRLAARARRRARRAARVGRPARRPRQHVPHARGAELRDRGGGTPRASRRAASGSTRRSRRRRSTSSSGCSSASARSRRRRSCASWLAASPGVHAPTSQMRTLRELEPPSTDEGFGEVEQVPFARAPRAGASGAGVFVAAAALDRARLGAARSTRATRARLTWSSTGAPTAIRTRSRPGRPPLGRGVRAGRERAVPAPRRPAELLVPAAATGAAARVRAGTRRRPVPLDPRRNRARPPDARDDARRPLRPGLRTAQRSRRQSGSSFWIQSPVTLRTAPNGPPAGPTRSDGPVSRRRRRPSGDHVAASTYWLLNHAARASEPSASTSTAIRRVGGRTESQTTKNRSWVPSADHVGRSNERRSAG